jgi:hypothetical protein
VVHTTARTIENYSAQQKGGARLVIHAMYYESRINMACRSFKKICISPNKSALSDNSTHHLLFNSNNTLF